jgi:hypothetical protein
MAVAVSHEIVDLIDETSPVEVQRSVAQPAVSGARFE